MLKEGRGGKDKKYSCEDVLPSLPNPREFTITLCRNVIMCFYLLITKKKLQEIIRI